MRNPYFYQQRRQTLNPKKQAKEVIDFIVNFLVNLEQERFDKFFGEIIELREKKKEGIKK